MSIMMNIMGKDRLLMAFSESLVIILILLSESLFWFVKYVTPSILA